MNEPKNDIFDIKDVELKMPEENFLAPDPEPERSSKLPIVLFGVILLLIGILGALLWWGSQHLSIPAVSIPKFSNETDVPVETQTTDGLEVPDITEELDAIANIQDSDELDAIEFDLNNTDIDNMDQEFSLIETALQ